MTDQHLAPGCPHSELAIGWALHSLEPAEEILVAAHLPDCSECTRTVAETEEIGAVLGLSVPVAVPSAELEQRILAVVTTAQSSSAPPLEPAAPVMPSAPALATRPAPPFVPRASGLSPETPGTSPPWRVPRRRPRREPICVPDVLKLLAVALLVLAVAAAIVFVVIP